MGKISGMQRYAEQFAQAKAVSKRKKDQIREVGYGN